MRRIRLVLVVIAVLVMMVLSATTAAAQTGEEIEAKAGADTVAHPLICHAMGGKAETKAC